MATLVHQYTFKTIYIILVVEVCTFILFLDLQQLNQMPIYLPSLYSALLGDMHRLCICQNQAYK